MKSLTLKEDDHSIISEQKKRLSEPDIAKCICISIVILQHSGLLPNNLFQFFIMFDIPLFFFLSGFVSAKSTKKTAFLEYLKQKTKRLLLPYFLFYLIDVLVYFVLQLIHKAPVDLLAIRHNLILLFTLFGVSVVWFLSALYFSDILFHLFLSVKKTGKIYIGILLFILLIIARIVRTPFEDWYVQVYATHNGIVPVLPDIAYYLTGTFLRIPMCFLIYAMGYHVGNVMSKKTFQGFMQKWNKLPAAFQTSITLVVAMFLFVTSYYASVLNEVGNLAVYHYGKNILLYLIAAITGMAATLMVSHAIVLMNIRPLIFVLTYFGKNTLIILLSHLDFYILITAMNLSARIPHIQNRLMFRLPVILFLTLLIEVPVIEIINRYLPFLVGKTGNKKSPSDQEKA